MSAIDDAIGGRPASDAAVELLVSGASGGPIRYNGAGLRKAHGNLHIELRRFDAVAQHLAGALHCLGVPDPVATLIMERMRALSSQIVNTPSMAAAAANRSEAAAAYCRHNLL